MTIVVTLMPCGQPVNPWFDQCQASVRGRATHVVLLDQLGYMDARLWSYSQGETMANLDHDDVLPPGGLEACEAALQATGAGVAFTWQRSIDGSGGTQKERTEPVRPRDVASTPDSIHHLSVLRTDLIPPQLLSEIKAARLLHIDWVVRAYLALVHGAVQVPMIGYLWRQHRGQMTRNMDKADFKQIDTARKFISRWAHRANDGRAFQTWKENA